MIKYDYKTAGIRQLTDTLKSVDSKLYTKLRKNLKNIAVEISPSIKTKLDATIVPLSGMLQTTEMQRNLHFAGVKISIQVPTNFNRKGASSLVNMIVDTPKGSPGFLAIEKAGSKGPAGSSGTGQAANLIAYMTTRVGLLKGTGRRQQRGLSWAAFYSHKDVLNRAAKKVVEDMVKEYKVRVIPDYMLYRESIEIKRKAGYKNKEKFQEWLLNND
jgi:hypothetical protein